MQTLIREWNCVRIAWIVWHTHNMQRDICNIAHRQIDLPRHVCPGHVWWITLVSHGGRSDVESLLQLAWLSVYYAIEWRGRVFKMTPLQSGFSIHGFLFGATSGARFCRWPGRPRQSSIERLAMCTDCCQSFLSSVCHYWRSLKCDCCWLVWM